MQKWVVLIECVGWMIFLNGPVNCSLRNGSPIGALGCGYPAAVLPGARLAVVIKRGCESSSHVSLARFRILLMLSD